MKHQLLAFLGGRTIFSAGNLDFPEALFSTRNLAFPRGRSYFGTRNLAFPGIRNV